MAQKSTQPNDNKQNKNKYIKQYPLLSRQYTMKLENIQEHKVSSPRSRQLFNDPRNHQIPCNQSSSTFSVGYNGNFNKHCKKRIERNILELRSCISAPLLLAVQHSVGSESSKAMDDKTANAARKYYEMIVNNDTSYDYKKHLIYNDLVIGAKSELKTNKNELNDVQEVELKYKIGINNQKIVSVKGSVLTVGRYNENDIYTGDIDAAVSRIQFFILLIGDSLIILDGWSFCGTKTIQINGEKNGLLHSLPNNRYVLRFNKNDRIHLRLGVNIDLIINPKECVVCMQNARVIRNICGHYALCTNCFNHILSSSNAKCPICRAVLHGNVNGLECNLTYNTESYSPL